MSARLGSLTLPTDRHGQPEIVLSARQYADAPPPPKRGMPESSRAFGRAGGASAYERHPSHGSRHASFVNGADGPSNDAAPNPEDFVFSDVTAAQYKEFSVVKINKHGKRQQRILGIDRERFYNLAHSREDPHGTSTTKALEWSARKVREAAAEFGLRQSGLNSGTKHAFRPMRDALDARIVSTDEPHAIEVTFKDREDFDKLKAQRYEAVSAREAAEIVAKLQHLMQLQGRSRTQRMRPTAD